MTEYSLLLGHPRTLPVNYYFSSVSNGQIILARVVVAERWGPDPGWGDRPSGGGACFGEINPRG